MKIQTPLRTNEVHQLRLSMLPPHTLPITLQIRKRKPIVSGYPARSSIQLSRRPRHKDSLVRMHQRRKNLWRQCLHICSRISNHNALIQAARKGLTSVVKLLLAWKGSNGEPVDPTAQENAALIQASKHGHLDIVQLLLSIPSVNPKNNLALYEACCHGHTLVAQLLSARNAQADVRVAVRTCEQAALLGHTQTARFLLEQVRVPVSASILLTASDAGHTDTVALLLERAEAEFHPQTLSRALALAAAKNRVQVVARLVAVKSAQFSVAPALVKAASAGVWGCFASDLVFFEWDWAEGCCSS